MKTTWSFSPHAVERALDMALEGDTIRAVLENPEGKWKCPEPPREIWWRKGGKVALVVNPETRRVITVLWNTHHKMSRQEDDERFWRDQMESE